jgi:hypothetical protein
MHRIHQIAERTSNEPGIAWRDVIVASYMGMLPSSMGDQPHLMTAAFKSALSRSDAEIELTGIAFYSTNPTLGCEVAFTATIRTEDRVITIVETEGAPEKRFTYRGHLSANGRLISLTASSADNVCPEVFYLVHEEVIYTIMEHEDLA